MRTHTAALMNYLNGSHRKIKVKLKFSNSEIIDTVQTLDINTDFGDSIAIGNTVSSRVKCVCKTPEFLISGREFELSFGVKIPTYQSETWTKIGKFQILPEEIENRLGFTTFTAYDRMYTRTRLEYQTQLSYPASLQNILNEICGKCGFAAPALTTNPDIETDVLSGYTLRDALGYVASFEGKNAYVDRDGELTFKWFTSCEYTADGKLANVPHSDERDIKIQKLICSTGDDNIQAGDGSDGLIFNNPLMNSDRLNEMLPDFQNFEYRRLDADIPVGNYLIESGDILHVSYTINQTTVIFTVPAMSISFHYDGGISCKLSSHGVADSVMKSISAKKFRDHTRLTGLQKEIKHVTESITGATGGYVRINFGDDGKTAEILILDQPEAENAVNVWRFNKNGLGHSHNGYDGPFDDVALTADGHIVADLIAGNQISGVRIETIAADNESYLHMDKAHLTYYIPGAPDDKKIAGIYAFYQDDRNGMMISCEPNSWIAFGADEGGTSNASFRYMPYWRNNSSGAPFWFGENVMIDGTLFLRDWGSGNMTNVMQRIHDLEERVSNLESTVGGIFINVPGEEG